MRSQLIALSCILMASSILTAGPTSAFNSIQPSPQTAELWSSHLAVIYGPSQRAEVMLND